MVQYQGVPGMVWYQVPYLVPYRTMFDDYPADKEEESRRFLQGNRGGNGDNGGNGGNGGGKGKMYIGFLPQYET